MTAILDDDSDADDIASWMARRQRQVAGAGDAEMAGRDAWAMGTRNGLNPPGTTYADLLKLGVAAQGEDPLVAPQASGAPWVAAQETSVPRLGDKAVGVRAPSLRRSPTPVSPGGRRVARFGALQVDPLSDVERNKLQGDQAQFGRVRRDLDIKNSYLAIPALAPAMAVVGLEGGAALAARLAGPVEEIPPFRFPGPARGMPGRGDNFRAYLGRQANARLKEVVDAKPGWESQPRVPSKQTGRIYRPDAAGLSRNPLEPNQRYYLEQKPNTASGRNAAARDIRFYKKEFEQKVRAIFYDPQGLL